MKIFVSFPSIPYFMKVFVSVTSIPYFMKIFVSVPVATGLQEDLGELPPAHGSGNVERCVPVLKKCTQFRTIS